MDPTRLTLYSAVGGALLAALVLGPVFIVALVNHDGEDGSLQEASMSRPAAQEAFARALKDEDAAYLDDRFEMSMEVIGTGDVLMGEALVRVVPQTGDYQAVVALELKAIADAYGIENPQDEDAGSENQSQDPGATDPFAELWTGLDEEDWERWEMSASRVGEVNSLSLGPGTGWSWRDYNETEGFTLFSDEEEEEDPSGFSVDAPEPSVGGEELARFLDANESITVHEVEEAEWEGTPAWKITTTITEEGIEEEAVFHFRQADMAPLAIDLYLDGADEEGFFSFYEDEEDPETLEKLKDLEIHMKMRFRYGGTIQLEPPEGFTRIAANPDTDDERGTDRIVRTLTAEHDQVVPLDTLELHLVVLKDGDPDDLFAPPDVDQTLGVLRLKAAHEIETEDHRIVYEDQDKDGLLSSGDLFYVETTDEDGIWSNDTHSVQLLVYDSWAGAHEGAPGPAVVWLMVLGLLGAGLVRRRRS